MFDPFENRASRDIRNQLCTLFLQALEEGDTTLFYDRAEELRLKAPDKDHLDFIENRIRRCTQIFKAIKPNGAATPVQADGFTIAFKLWSAQLYFECHEWLENIWRTAEGPEKKAVQALIRSAGAAVLSEAGRTEPAQSSARKAADLLDQFEALLPAPFSRKLIDPVLTKILVKE